MMGIDPVDQREMMPVALAAILDLFDGKRVTLDAGWFKLRDARLQVLPYQQPRMPVAVACAITPNGPVTAGRLGATMLSVAASTGPGFAALPDHWRIYEEAAREAGRAVHRDGWRVVVPIHVAETREQAMAPGASSPMSWITCAGSAARAPARLWPASSPARMR
jgi:limonene 1,2-monooxygenase